MVFELIGCENYVVPYCLYVWMNLLYFLSVIILILFIIYLWRKLTKKEDSG